jgi:hypothetical protein
VTKGRVGKDGEALTRVGGRLVVRHCDGNG